MRVALAILGLVALAACAAPAPPPPPEGAPPRTTGQRYIEPGFLEMCREHPGMGTCK